MAVFMILVLVTFLVIAGYFIQFAAQYAEGSLKPFGRYLSLWVFVLAALVIVAAALQPALRTRGIGFGGPGFARGAAFAREPGFARGPGAGFFQGRRGGRRFEREAAPPAGTQTPATETPAPQAAPATP
jgi:hypothetical protein